MDKEMTTERVRPPSIEDYAKKFEAEALSSEHLAEIFASFRRVIDALLKTNHVQRNAEEGDALILNIAPPNATPEIFWVDKEGEMKGYWLDTPESEEEKRYFNIDHVPNIIRIMAMVRIFTSGVIEVDGTRHNIRIATDDLELIKEEIIVPPRPERPKETKNIVGESNEKHLEAIFYVLFEFIRDQLERSTLSY